MSEKPSPNKKTALTDRVARGAAWIFGAGLAARLLGTVNTLIVARLLVPEDIGLVAVATVTLQLLQGLSDIGVSQAVVKFQSADRDDLNTLFSLSFLRGVLVGVLLAAAAPLMAAFYDDQRMFGVFLGVSIFPVMSGLINPRFYEFERDLRFSREFVSTVVNKLVGVSVSVAIAFVFRTYWAIILGLLAGGAVQLLLSYALRPFAPRFSLKSIRKVWAFSGWLAGVSFMAALNNKLDIPILARFSGGAGAGIYYMGFQLSEMATSQLAAPLTRAIYPGLSSLQEDRERMRIAFLRGVAALGVFATPAAFGLAFVAEDLVRLLLGEKWRDAARVVQILAPVIGLQTLFYAIQSYAVALGLTRLVFFRELIFFMIRTPAFVWAAATRGLEGAVWAAAALGGFHVVLNLALYARASGSAFWDPLVSARRSLAAVAAMSVYFMLLRPYLPLIEASALPLRLCADVVAGSAVYGLAHLLLWRAEGRPDGVERRLLMAAGAFFPRSEKI